MKTAIEHYEAALKEAFPKGATGDVFHHWNEARKAVEQPAQQEPVSLKAAAKKAGINLPERYIPTTDDAIAAGDSVLMNEQAALLRECRLALDDLLRDKPMLGAKRCGTTTLGNLRAELGAYRPQGVFGSHPQAREPVIDKSAAIRIATALGWEPKREWVGLTNEERNGLEDYCEMIVGKAAFDAIEAKLREKNA